MDSKYILTSDGNFISEDEIYHALSARFWKESKLHKYISRKWGKKGWVYKYPADSKPQSSNKVTTASNIKTTTMASSIERAKTMLKSNIANNVKTKTSNIKQDKKSSSDSIIKKAQIIASKFLEKNAKTNIKDLKVSKTSTGSINSKTNNTKTSNTNGEKSQIDTVKAKKVQTFVNKFLDKNAKTNLKDLKMTGLSKDDNKNKTKKDGIVSKIFGFLDKIADKIAADTEKKKVENAADLYAKEAEQNGYKLTEKFNTLKRINSSNTDNDLNQSLINPNYHKGVDDIGYGTNCAYCTLAYDLRRRGYDVEAMPNKSNRGLTTGEICDMYQGNLLSSSDELVQYIAYDPSDKNKKVTAALQSAIADATKKRLNAMPDGSYGHFGVQAITGGGHSMIWEKENGQIVIRDCQSNEKYTYDEFIDKYFDNCWEIETLRLDNKIPNEKILKLVRNRK